MLDRLLDCAGGIWYSGCEFLNNHAHFKWAAIALPALTLFILLGSNTIFVDIENVRVEFNSPFKANPTPTPDMDYFKSLEPRRNP